MTRKKLMFVFGTRPEAIKLAPLILKAQEADRNFEAHVVVTGQHRQMLDDVMAAFHVKPDMDLNIMKPDQGLFSLTSKVFAAMEGAMEVFAPDIVIVQGDTTSAFAAAISGYYAGKKVAHVEAGLRTGNKWAPFPEEINRKTISSVADYHFAPTEKARENLLREGYESSTIHVTGNTVIDALLFTAERVRETPCPLSNLTEPLSRCRMMVLITGHRRENFGERLFRICGAFRTLATKNPDVLFIYPVHLNPNVQKAVRSILGGIPNLHLLPPVAYPDFVWMMQKCHLIISDSGGIQEEAPALRKPVLVTRHVSERPEAIEAGVAKLVDDDPDKIIPEAQRLMDDADYYRSMASGVSPYGDGRASERILAVLSA
ncbi:MAG: UDP-N-acetylglucosamine 2-epimerase (non-hydrolyzing) [Candidatus Sumerlaeota bacterium]|nr:UDP-N-acetylglucosamine 2-epimerase (non-hydrolyzing) [Candidatus Sumerlaeota bacterium]